MRKGILTVLTMWLLIFFQVNAGADSFVSGSTGADGALAPLVDITLQLPTDGVFNFTTVTIPAGVTVKFLRNTANTPVYFLATGDVTIAGTIVVSGENGANGDTGNIAPVPGGKGGPGGFDGGYGAEPGSTGISPKSTGDGLGPGGGSANNPALQNCSSPYISCSKAYYIVPSGGSYASVGRTNSCICVGPTATYGNVSLLPLIGGSGGGGGLADSYYTYYGGGGGGGGGAILMASSGKITITGTIKANGGNGGSDTYATGGGGGSGGAIRLIANSITGTGNLQATGGTGGTGKLSVDEYGNSKYFYKNGESGGAGRIRLEAYTVTVSANPSPSVTTPNPVFVPNIPTLTITKIAGNQLPATSAGSYASPDITLPSTTTNPISIEIAGVNIPAGTSVTLKAIPQSGAASSTTAALQGTNASSTATASLSISTTSPSVITAEATFTVQTAMYYDGEKIEKVRVAANMGRESEVTYITEKGREVPAEILMASLMR